MTAKSFTCRWSLLALTAVLSFISPNFSAAQSVGIAPDAKTLGAAFSPADEAAFKQPEKVFYPETWFHFIGGNVSKEGIDADLKAIADAKISGVQWFHGYFGGPWPATGHQLTTLSPEWEEMVGYLGSKAKELGLRLTVQTCPGWSMAGGPWIQPENAMRKLVWSRTDIQAGQKASTALPKGDPSTETWKDYRDIAVLAFPTPLGDTGQALLPENINGPEEWKTLLSGLGSNDIQLKPGTTTTVTFTLPKGQVIRTLELPPVGAFSHSFCYDPGVHVKLTGKVAGEDKVLIDADFPMSNWQDGGVTPGKRQVHPFLVRRHEEQLER